MQCGVACGGLRTDPLGWAARGAQGTRAPLHPLYHARACMSSGPAGGRTRCRLHSRRAGSHSGERAWRGQWRTAAGPPLSRPGPAPAHSPAGPALRPLSASRSQSAVADSVRLAMALGNFLCRKCRGSHCTAGECSDQQQAGITRGCHQVVGCRGMPDQPGRVPPVRCEQGAAG